MTPKVPRKIFICACGCGETGVGIASAKYINRGHKTRATMRRKTARKPQKITKKSEKTLEKEYYLTEIRGTLRHYVLPRGPLSKSHL